MGCRVIGDRWLHHPSLSRDPRTVATFHLAIFMHHTSRMRAWLCGSAWIVLVFHISARAIPTDLIAFKGGDHIVMPTVEVVPSGPIGREFEIVNQSNAPIQIHSLSVGCGCITVVPKEFSLPTTIEPNGLLKLVAQLDVAKANVGTFKYPITIHSNAGDLHGVIEYSYKPAIDCSPRHVTLTSIPGRVTKAEATFLSGRNINVSAQMGLITVAVDRSRTRDGLVQCRLALSTSASTTDTLHDLVSIIDTDTGRVLQQLPVTIKPADCAILKPANVVFRAGERSRTVHVRDRFNVGIEIAEVSTSADWLRVVAATKTSFIVSRAHGDSSRDALVMVRLVARQEPDGAPVDAGVVNLSVIEVGD